MARHAHGRVRPRHGRHRRDRTARSGRTNSSTPGVRIDRRRREWLGKRMARASPPHAGHPNAAARREARSIPRPRVGVILLQTIEGPDTISRRAEICHNCYNEPIAHQGAAMAITHSWGPGGANEAGYNAFTIGGFKFIRDEYFATSTGRPAPTRCRSIPFLGALMRDVAWGFFYGIVNFDDVFGTVNHYGNVELFAGRSTTPTAPAELHYVESFTHASSACAKRSSKT